jgi:polysaccharide biosynthesis protein PslJ
VSLISQPSTYPRRSSRFQAFEFPLGLSRKSKIGILAVVVGTQFGLAYLLTKSQTLGVGSAVLVAGAIVAARYPSVLWLAALPANYAYWRVGPASLDLSLADVVVLAAIVAAIPFVPWRSASLHRFERLFAWYLAIMTVCVMATPTRVGVLELFHRTTMVLGAVLIGSAIGVTGRAGLALKIMFFVSGTVALEAIRQTLASNLSPAYPFGIHKNGAGALLAFTIVITLTTRTITQIPRLVYFLMQVLYLGGLLSTQARGAIIALTVAFLVAVVRGDGVSRNPFLVGGIAVVTTVALKTFSSLANDPGTDQFSSVNSRVVTYEAATKIWSRNKIFGGGIKFWRDPRFNGAVGFGEPHNVVISALAETGVVGLAAFLLFVAAVSWTLAKLKTPIGSAAFLVFVARFVETQFGIFWVANTGSFAWLMVGLAIGDATGIESRCNQELSVKDQANRLNEAHA